MWHVGNMGGCLPLQNNPVTRLLRLSALRFAHDGESWDSVKNSLQTVPVWIVPTLVR
jgi:hypothetical protein